MSRRWKEQHWILDALLAQNGAEGMFRALIPRWIERGMRLPDIQCTLGRVRAFAMLPREWGRTGRQLEELAGPVEAAGHALTAAELLHRAALCYARAQWGIFADDHPEKIAHHGKVLETYRRMIKLANLPIERVEVPFDGTSFPALFHRVPGPGKAPAVLFVPGMDMVKAEYPNPFLNHFARAGCTCS